MSTLKLTNKTLLELVTLSIITAHSSHSTIEIAETLKKINFDVPQGSLYPLLSNLRHKKIIDSSFEEMDDGSIQKCYFLTETGDVRFKELKILWRNIERVVYKSHQK